MDKYLHQLGYGNKIETFRSRGYDLERFNMFVDKDLKSIISADTGL